jgi:pimeloyl-ACP methyl ester carboxylesterase
MVNFEENFRKVRNTLYVVRVYLGYERWLSRVGRKGSTGRVRIGDVSIFFRRYGSGPAVLLLHGGFTFSKYWAGQIPVIASDYTVIAMDSRGHGHSTLGAEKLTYEQMAVDTIGLIEKLGLGPVHLIGWSDGGCTSLALALARPDLVRSMVLLGTPYNTSNYDDNSKRRIDEILRPGSYSLLGIRAIQRWMNPDADRTSEFIDAMREMWQLFPDYSENDLGKIDSQVLVIAGDHDEFLSHEDDPFQVFRETADALPHGKMAIVKGGTHNVHIEKPGQVNELIMEFLSRQGS